jgi:RNA polymerase sigma factor (sigma-70 family)
VSNLTNREEKDELKKLMANDDKAFSELVNLYKERIFLVVLRIVRNREEAKDLAQEAFVKAYHSRQSFRAESGFYTWIYRIAVNLALNYINRNRDRQAESLENIQPIIGDSSANSELENRELHLAIDKAIEKLPARQRTVFVLRHYEQKSHAEIGEVLSITEGAVKANYHQAIKKLKEYLGIYLKEGRLVE